MEYVNFCIPDELMKKIESYIPDSNSRYYACHNKASDLTVWNKHAVNREILYGCKECRVHHTIIPLMQSEENR